jgi:RimJ/RimL family protein N-acetyltransferase
MRASYAVDFLPPVSPQLIGRITLRNPREHCADLGIYLHPEWCGQGYGSAALLVMQRYLWGAGMQTLALDVAVDNNRAIQAYQRAGWRAEGQIERNGHVYYVMAVRAQ